MLKNSSDRAERDSVGKHMSFLFARKAPRFPDKELITSLRNGETRQIEVRLRTQGKKFFGGTLLLVMPSGGDGSLIHCQVWLTSERQRSEGVLRRSEERLRYALEAASDGLWDWDLKTDGVVFSARVSEIFEEKASGDDVSSTHVKMWKSRIHPDDDDKRQRLLQLHLEGQTPAFESEYRIQNRTGSLEVGDRERAGNREEFSGKTCSHDRNNHRHLGTQVRTGSSPALRGAIPESVRVRQ